MTDVLPASVIAAGKLADEMADRMAKGENPYGEPAPIPGTPAPTPDATPPADVTPAPPATPEPTPAPTPPPVSDDFKHKYDVLQGKYNAEVPLLHAENAKLKAELALKTVQPAPAPAQTVNPITVSDLSEDPIIKEFSTEYPDVWKPVSKVISTLEAKTTEALGKLSSQVDQIVKHNTKSDADRFYETLDTKVKDWESIQRTPEFSQWAAQIDRYTGIPRGNLLRDASQSFDANRTAAFFEDYLREITPPTPNPSPNPVPPIPPRTPPLAPPASKGGQPPRVDGGAPPEIIKASEIEAFYRSVQRGKFQGTPEQLAAAEARYGKAVAEFRVDRNA